jgi:hypothetical protein
MRMRITAGTVLLFCALGSGCGPKTREPSDWMLGVFSSANAGADLVEATMQYTIYDDGTVDVADRYHCGSDVTEWQLEWEPRDAESLVMTAPPDAEPFVDDYYDSWIVRRTSACPYEIVRTRGDDPPYELPLYRGELLMEWLPEDPECIGSGCRQCLKTWAEEPPACEEETL